MYIKEIKSKGSIEFSTAKLESRIKQSNVFKIVKRKYFKSRNLYLSKLQINYDMKKIEDFQGVKNLPLIHLSQEATGREALSK